MPSFIFRLLCVVTALFGAFALSLLIVIGLVLAGVETTNSKVAAPLTVIGLLLGFFVSPLMLVRYRKSIAERHAHSNHEQQVIAVSENETPLTLSTSTSRTEAAASGPVHEPHAAPESLLKTLETNQNRQFLSLICFVCLLISAAFFQIHDSGHSVVGFIAFGALNLSAIYFLFFPKKRKVFLAPPPEKYIAEVINISRVHGIKCVNPPRAKLRIRNQFWGLRYDFLVLSIDANKNDWWPRLLLIAPDQCFWRNGFAFGLAGWKSCDTAKLHIRPFSMDVPERGFHWGKPVVGHTWEHATMHGDRDHRYKSNRQIDLVRLYGVEIVMPDGDTWLLAASEENRDVVSRSLTAIVSAANSERHLTQH
jgi:hypothetical protein